MRNNIVEPTHQCMICKEIVVVVNNDADLSGLEHLSAVHGIVVQAAPRPRSSDEIEKDDALTRHLENIRGSKINN